MCGLTGNKEDMIKIGSRYYHKGDCENEKRKEQKEGEDYKTLVQYLCNLCEVQEPNPVWLSTIKRFREDSNYTSIGIMLTVKHYYEYYQEAKETFIENLQRKKTTKQFFEEGNQMVVHEKITVKRKHQVNDYKQKKLIDMSIFEKMGDDE